MQRTKRQKFLITIGVIAAITLVASGTFLVLAKINSPSGDPYKQPAAQTPAADQPAASNTTPPATTTPAPAATTPSADQVSSIKIDVLMIEAAYVKGIGGFEYEVLRTGSTRYVEFRSPELTGTKCTNDQGAFASIVVNPASTDSTNFAATKKLGDETYGLSLSGTNCTSNIEALQKYQKSFQDAFPLLKQAG